MRLSDFDYPLPRSAIAQHPLKERDQSRLLVVHRATGELEDRKFFEIPQYFSSRDILVVNNCLVIPARIFATRKTRARLEITLLGKISDGSWECLVKGNKPGEGEEIELDRGVTITFLKERDLDEAAGFRGGLWRVKFSDDRPEVLEKLGVPPLPPYIKRTSKESYAGDRECYQTIYAREPGAVAAPTAGLHFTERVLKKIKARQVPVAELTLYVGYGTFAPVRVEEIERHKMHSEKYEVGKEAAEKINAVRKAGGRVIAVGTTVARTLEAASDASGSVRPGANATDIFITPGYKFKAVDALLTNFHVPKSTLLMLVSAFAGLDLIQKSYAHAMEQGYRFLSYGDCMLIL